MLFFIQDKSEKEKADFLKQRYGIGGSSHALSGADNSHADYSGKGLKLERGELRQSGCHSFVEMAKGGKACPVFD